MKKIIFALVFCITFFSCSNDKSILPDKIEEKKLTPMNLFPVKDHGITKYIDDKGNVVFDFSNTSEGLVLYKPSEGFIGFDSDEKMGYVDYHFNVVIQPEYDLAGVFKDGVALVRIIENSIKKYGFLNTSGEWKIEPYFDYANQFFNGLAMVKVDKKIGYINKNGAIIIQPQFDSADNDDFANFHEGFALVKKDNKYTYIDKNGNILVQLDVKFARPFHNGMALFIIKDDHNRDRFGFIDTTGKIVIRPIYAWTADYSDGYAPVYYGDNYGPMVSGHNDEYYIDKSGKKAFGKEFYSCSAFSEDLAKVEIKSESGKLQTFIINNTGKIEFKVPDYISDIRPFNNGLAQIRVDSETDEKGNKREPTKIGYINAKGIIVWEPSY